MGQRTRERGRSRSAISHQPSAISRFLSFVSRHGSSVACHRSSVIRDTSIPHPPSPVPQGLRGFTIIELIIVIVVLGIALPPLLFTVSDTLEDNVKVRTIQTASVLGRSLLEEILSKRYDENTSSPWSNPLGPNGGETRATYDDIDDFDGFTENPISGFTGYSSSVTVYYVNPDTAGLDTAQPDSSNTLDYKRIDVTITHAIAGTLRFSTVTSRSRSL